MGEAVGYTSFLASTTAKFSTEEAATAGQLNFFIAAEIRTRQLIIGRLRVMVVREAAAVQPLLSAPSQTGQFANILKFGH